jgi:membrane-associated phospholipid phosphatase
LLGSEIRIQLLEAAISITNGNADGNDQTAGDAAWKPFIGTPPHPEYPSGHSTNSSAMAKILTLEFGDTPGIPITLLRLVLLEPGPALVKVLMK